MSIDKDTAHQSSETQPFRPVVVASSRIQNMSDKSGLQGLKYVGQNIVTSRSFRQNSGV